MFLDDDDEVKDLDDGSKVKPSITKQSKKLTKDDSSSDGLAQRRGRARKEADSSSDEEHSSDDDDLKNEVENKIFDLNAKEWENTEDQKYGHVAKAISNASKKMKENENIIDMVSQYSKNMYETASLKKEIDATKNLSVK